MAEPRQSPIGNALPWSFSDGSLTLSEHGFLQQIGLRVKPPVAAYLGGIPIPLQPNRVASMREVRALWLGPDDWLVTAPQHGTADILGRLTGALQGRHATVTDLSAARAVIEINGPRARELLEKGCGIDLHPRAFGPGNCAQTLFARLPVIIDQVAAIPTYRLFVRRSASRWMCDWLIDAAEEFRFV